ncbi:MAG TPA: hypothetical protein VFS43_35775 [Polyangiaceae bacterium]|nr:hypothetical protein [Polyangiaceae bacterium]
MSDHAPRLPDRGHPYQGAWFGEWGRRWGKMLERHGFERPGGPKTKWRISHAELMAKWPELVLSAKEVRAERLRAEARADAA